MCMGSVDYYPAFENFEIDFSQFWRSGNIIDCRDRKPGQWGNWSTHYIAIGAPYEMLFYDVADKEEIGGETFYTKQRFTWNLDPDTTVALGYYVGVPAAVDSTAATNINYLIKHYHSGNITFRTKVRDANGNYLYHDDAVAPNTWIRTVTIALSSFGVVVHPLNLVDIGCDSLRFTAGSGEF